MKKLTTAIITILLLILSVPVFAGEGAAIQYKVDTWEYCGGSFYGEVVDGMRVLHDVISSSHADGETNYADVYTECETPPPTIPANEELALKVRIYGDVKRNDRGRGIYMSCEVRIAPSNLDRSATLNAGSSMRADDYSALSWGNYAGGFGTKETTVRGKMYSSDNDEGDMLSIYFRTSTKQCEWRYRLRKGESSSPSSSSDSDITGTPTPEPTATPTPTPTPASQSSENPPQAATIGSLNYSVMNGEASVIGVSKKNVKTLTIPATVKINGKKYKVTGIDDGALAGLKKLTSLTIGKNIKAIDAQAIASCPKLKTITIKTKLLTNASVKADAFKDDKAVQTVKCPGGKKAAYKKILTKKGLGKKVKWK